jgi:cyclophilin family peptidyl-prolyl cis-trans isomerase
MAERRRQQRRKEATIAGALVIALIGALGVFLAFRGGGDSRAGASATPATPTPTGSASASTVVPSPGPTTVACGAKAPADATTPKPQFTQSPPTVLKSEETYTATLETSCGTIVIRLLSKDAPQTVNSFVFLAQHGYFDGQRFHRLDTSIDVIQGGDPLGTGTGGPGYSIPDELTGGESYGPGVVAMANAGPNTGGSQFFIVTGPNGHKLDANPNYTIFGRVIRGLDVARRIQRLPIQDPAAAEQGDLSGQQPKDAVYIDRVTIQTSPAKSGGSSG